MDVAQVPVVANSKKPMFVLNDCLLITSTKPSHLPPSLQTNNSILPTSVTRIDKTTFFNVDIF